MSDFCMRNATAHDLLRIREIMEESWRGQGAAWFLEQTYGLIGGKAWTEWFWPVIQNIFEQHPEWVFVSTISSRVIGVASLSTDPASGVGHIGYNALDPAWRGRGFGLRQIRHIVDRLRAEHMHYVGVYVALNEGHRAAKAIYERVGCRTVATTETRYGRLGNTPDAPRAPVSTETGLVTRCATLADIPFIERVAERALADRHPDAIIERRHGLINGRSWTDRAFAGFAGRLAKQANRLLIAERDGTACGAIAYSIDLARELGRIEHLYLVPQPGGEEAGTQLAMCAAEHFRRAGVSIIETRGYLSNGRSSTPEAVVVALGLRDLVIRSEYKFQALTPGRPDQSTPGLTAGGPALGQAEGPGS